jgi:hypothetical protein
MQRDQRKRQELGKPERATVPSPRAAGDEVSVDRDRLLNDILNTGVMGALIGGFALSNLQLNYDTAKTVEVAIYLTSFIGVHACTCSCVTSAMLCESQSDLYADSSLIRASNAGCVPVNCLLLLLVQPHLPPLRRLCGASQTSTRTSCLRPRLRAGSGARPGASGTASSCSCRFGSLGWAACRILLRWC